MNRQVWNRWTTVLMLIILVATESYEKVFNKQDGLSYAAHYGGGIFQNTLTLLENIIFVLHRRVPLGFVAGVLLGIIVTKNPVLRWHER